jgi:hypothetical protein
VELNRARGSRSGKFTAQDGANSRVHGKTFPSPLVFSRPLEECAGSPAWQTGGYFAARAFSRLCWRCSKSEGGKNSHIIEVIHVLEGEITVDQLTDALKARFLYVGRRS